MSGAHEEGSRDKRAAKKFFRQEVRQRFQTWQEITVLPMAA